MARGAGAMRETATVGGLPLWPNQQLVSFFSLLVFTLFLLHSSDFSPYLYIINPRKIHLRNTRKCSLLVEKLHENNSKHLFYMYQNHKNKFIHSLFSSNGQTPWGKQRKNQFCGDLIKWQSSQKAIWQVVARDIKMFTLWSSDVNLENLSQEINSKGKKWVLWRCV